MCEELRTLRRWANTLIRSPLALCFGLLMDHGWIATDGSGASRSVGVLAGPHISVRVYVPLLEINLNWRESLPPQRLKPYEKFAEMIDRHWDGLAAYCKPENKVALRFVEGVNNKIRVIQRRSYGL